jgi:hypothetical protein
VKNGFQMFGMYQILRKNLLSLVTIRQIGHKIIIKDGLLKINLDNDKLKTIMTRYEDEKLLRMQRSIILGKHDFVAAINSEMSSFRLWNF